MTFYSVSNPFMQVFNLQGTGLNDGDVYFGVAGQDPIDHPKTVYWNLAGTDEADQPIPTTGGYLYRSGTPAEIYLDSTYSIKVLDKKGGLVYYQANVNDPVFAIAARVDELESVAGPGLIPASHDESYAQATLGDRFLQEVLVTDDPYLAKCDGATDDADALDRVFAAWGSASQGAVIKFPGPCYVSRTIKLDRPVDTARSFLTLQGCGPKGGIITDQAIDIFSTTTRDGVNPHSENIILQNFRAEVTDASLNTHLFSDDFLRITAENCWFEKIKIVDSSFYLQEWKIAYCKAYRWLGTLIIAQNGIGPIFASEVDNCNFGAGQDVISGDYQGVRLTNNTAEGLRNFHRQSGGSSSVVSKNYLENNTDTEFTFSHDGGNADGVDFSGNSIRIPSGRSSSYPVALGDVRGFFGSGNQSNGNLYDMTGVRNGRILSAGDYATGNKFKPITGGIGPHYPRQMVAEGNGFYTGAVTALAGGGRAGAPQIVTGLTIVTVCATAGDSVVLPSTDDMFDPDFTTDGFFATQFAYRQYIIVNQGIANLAVMTSQNDFNNTGLNVTLTVAAGTSRTIAQIGPGVSPIFLN